MKLLQTNSVVTNVRSTTTCVVGIGYLVSQQNYFNGKQVKQRALKSLCPILEANRLHSLEKRKQPKSLNCIESYQYLFASSWIFFGYYLRNQRF
ncbi:hypothetical protein V6N13_147034 [Hibiscus sabdariffa]|uniref:Uncharacterized protein n=1 Tax=Hibiscus sabdariffa TaxID=183260 RepID=A0ABR2TUM2_9ROSI